MAKEAQKLVARTQTIEERVPTIQMNYTAFVLFEREVIVMMFSSHPLTAYEVFSNLIVNKYCSLLDAGKIKENGRHTMPTDQAEDFIDEHGGVEKAASILNSKFHADLASYKTIQRLCTDFAAIGWFGKRKLGKKAYYYLEKTTKAHLKKEFPNEFR